MAILRVIFKPLFHNIYHLIYGVTTRFAELYIAIPPTHSTFSITISKSIVDPHDETTTLNIQQASTCNACGTGPALSALVVKARLDA